MPLWKIQSCGMWYVAGSVVMWFWDYWQSNRRSWYRCGRKKLKCFVLCSKTESFSHLWALRFAVHFKFLNKHQSRTEKNIHFIMWWNRNFRMFMGLILISQQALQGLAFLCLLCWKLSPILGDGWMALLSLFRRNCFLKNLMGFSLVSFKNDVNHRWQIKK